MERARFEMVDNPTAFMKKISFSFLKRRGIEYSTFIIMVLVDVDSFLEDESLFNQTDASFERMFEELRDATLSPKERKNESTPHTQIVSSSHHGAGTVFGGIKNEMMPSEKKRSSSTKIKKGKSSSRSSSNAIGTLLPLPTIYEYAYSDSDSVERFKPTQTVESPPAVESSLHEIGWDTDCAVVVSATSALEKDGFHKSGSSTNKSTKNHSQKRSSRLEVHFGGAVEIDLEPPVYHAYSPEMEHPLSRMLYF
jgi:hypothetical protein